MTTGFANRCPRLDADGLAQWLDEIAAGPIMLAIVIVTMVATIVRVA